MTDLDLSEDDAIPGILIESTEDGEFEYYFDLAIDSEAMEGIEEELQSYGVEVDPTTDCPTDVYTITDFARERCGVRVDFTVQTKTRPSGKLADWWKEYKQERPVLDIRMYFPDGVDEPIGNVYLRSGDIVILEYEFRQTRLIQNILAPGGIFGYRDRSEIMDFFELLPK